MVFVVGVWRAFGGKDAGSPMAGSPDSRDYRGDRGRSIRASATARRHKLYFAKPS